MDDGLFAEFADADGLLRAIRELKGRGLSALEAFTPYSDERIQRELDGRPKFITRIGGIAAATGVVVGYGIQWLTAAVLYRIDIGGRPPHAVLAFIPITFETGVLFCALATTAAVIVGAGLPRLWRPAFEIPGFESVTRDRFWLFVGARDVKSYGARLVVLLRELGALRVEWPPRGVS